MFYPIPVPSGQASENASMARHILSEQYEKESDKLSEWLDTEKEKIRAKISKEIGLADAESRYTTILDACDKLAGAINNSDKGRDLGRASKELNALNTTRLDSRKIVEDLKIKAREASEKQIEEVAKRCEAQRKILRTELKAAERQILIASMSKEMQRIVRKHEKLIVAKLPK
jgi:hypothetical protein